MLYNRDDSPLYLFDTNLGRHNPGTNKLQYDYTTPKYFGLHLFDVFHEARKPPHKRFLIGPKRSGSHLQQEPSGNSTWISSVEGHKRWLLIPPAQGLTKSFIQGEHLRLAGEGTEPIHFFDLIWPRLKAQEHHPGGKVPNYIECI